MRVASGRVIFWEGDLKVIGEVLDDFCRIVAGKVLDLLWRSHIYIWVYKHD